MSTVLLRYHLLVVNQYINRLITAISKTVAVVWTETSCENGIVHNSMCYKIHREPVNWFTAVNRCQSNNGSLAVFDDHILSYFTSTLLVEGPLWIGLIKSWWTWPNAGLSYCTWWGTCTIRISDIYAVLNHCHLFHNGYVCYFQTAENITLKQQ